MTSFSEVTIVYDDGQPNVVQPPETLMANGWIPKRKGAAGQPLVANWLNWIFRELFRKINLSSMHDGAGVGTLYLSTSFIILYAISKTDPNLFLHAIGYKNAGGIPIMRVLNSNGLTLGAVTANDTPISGAAASTVALKVILSENP